jgi:signal peptidase II
MQERWPVTTLTREPPVDRGGSGRRSGLVRLATAAGVAAGVVLVDQLTKWWAVSRLSSGPIHVIWKLDLELTRNPGSSFSLLQGSTDFLMAVVVIAAAVLGVLAWRSVTVGRAALYGLILGGALGNLTDRLFRGGAVVDFVALHFWPTFNVADSCIVVGCALLIVSLLRGTRAA